MAFTDDNTLANDTIFRNKIKIAICKAAIDIVGEAPGVNADRMNKRHNLGVNIINDPTSYLDRFAYAAVAHGTLVSGSTDTDIFNRIAAIYSDMAGVLNQEGG